MMSLLAKPVAVMGRSALHLQQHPAFLAPSRQHLLSSGLLSRPVRPFHQTPPVQMGRRAAKIATRKNKADAVKAKIYGRFGKKLVSVVKQGGPDPSANSALSDLLKQARELGVPRDILDRNLKKAGEAKQADFTECVYEAYGPGGTGFIIECLTDNVNRSASDVKSAITKGGGKPAESGSVMFNFARQGRVVVSGSEDDVFEAAMEAGADDIQPMNDEEGNPTTSYRVYTAVDNYSAAMNQLRSLGLSVDGEASELVYRAQAEVEVDDEAFAKCEALVERLLDLDDVDAVYSNCEGLTA